MHGREQVQRRAVRYLTESCEANAFLNEIGAVGRRLHFIKTILQHCKRLAHPDYGVAGVAGAGAAGADVAGAGAAGAGVAGAAGAEDVAGGGGVVVPVLFSEKYTIAPITMITAIMTQMMEDLCMGRSPIAL